MKKLISIALLGATTSLMAMYAEEAYLYKDPRIMGMGGVNVAVGSYSSSVFSNPAGLVNIKKEHGIVVDILSTGLSLTAKAQDLTDDISDASDSDDDTDMVNVLKKYSGEHFHIGVNNYSSVSKNSELFAWSVGILEGIDLNIMTHGNGSETTGLLETTSRAYGGVVLAAAKAFDTPIGKLDIGVGIKYISQISYEGTLGINDLISDDEDEDIADILQEKYEKESSGLGVDLGVVYKPFTSNYWHPAFGLSIMNIGSINMDDNYGGQPMTVNFGASVSPDVKDTKYLEYIDSLVIGLDYVDIFGANKLRMYDLQIGDGTGAYTDYDSYDIIKKLRLGVRAGLIDSTYFSTAINLGVYHGSYTAGIDIMATILRINLATYEERVGDAKSNYADRRYMVQIGIGW